MHLFGMDNIASLDQFSWQVIHANFGYDLSGAFQQGCGSQINYQSSRLSSTPLLTTSSLRLLLVLVEVGRPVLMFDGEGFKALGHVFVLLLLLLLLLLLGEGETRGDARGRGAIAGSGPHRRLKHLHRITPLRWRRDVHLVQGRAGIRHGVSMSVGVLPRCFGRPGFSFALLVIIPAVV